MSKVLSVKYFAQNDNDSWWGVPGEVQCAPTSYAALAYFLAKGKFNLLGGQEPEDHYKASFISLGYVPDDRGDHSAHADTLAKCYGIIGKFSTTASKADILKSIDAGYPVVTPMNYKIAGHVTLTVGYTDDGLVVNDCYGVRDGDSDYYQYINPGYGNNAGKEDLYTWRVLNSTMFDFEGKAWAYIVSNVEK